MYADVIPLLRMPRTTSTFTYRIPSSLEGMLVVGQCVRVPWRGRSIAAVVHSLSEQKPVAKRLSEIESLIESTPSWDAAILQALLQTAKATFSSPATVAQALFADVPRRVTAAQPFTMEPSAKSPLRVSLATTAVDDLKSALAAATEHRSFLAHSQAERLFAIQTWIKQTPGQLLILTPTLFDANELASFLSGSLKERIMLWGGPESTGKRWQRWQAIRDGHARIVIATRSGALLPLKELSLIIIDQADDQDHRSWEAAPNYDSRAIAAAVCKQRGIPCRRVSFFPQIEARPAWVEAKSSWPPLTMVVHTPLQPLIAETVLDDMSSSLKQGSHVLVLCTQRAAASAYLCLDCQYRWLCPQCQTPLHEREQVLACHHCSEQQSMPSSCPKCGSQRLRGFAAGAEALAAELPKQLKHPAILFTASDEALGIINLKQPTIILSTPFTWRRFAGRTKLPLTQVVFYQPERLLFTPDYRANEWYLRTLAWHRIMVQAYFHVPLTVQSGLPDHHSMSHFSLTMPWHVWQQQERQSRQTLAMPPFGYTFLLTLKEATPAEVQQIDKQLRHDLPQAVFGPRQNNTQATWFVKIPASTHVNLDKLNNSVYSKVLISPDPERVF